jgi:hypothetical protein
MTSIPISKERGLDPHMASCIRCGEENGLTVGVLVKATDENGNTVYTQQGREKWLNMNRSQAGLPALTGWEEVTDSKEVVPMGTCEKCDLEISNFKQELENGGVFFRCSGCETSGMVTGDTELAKMVRIHGKTPAPDPIGVEFNECSEHGGKDNA